MNGNHDFVLQLKDAVEAKAQWYNECELPRILDLYRFFHTCVKSILQALLQRGLIIPDPYKVEKKVMDIELPDTTPFSDSETGSAIGARISDYESMLDYVCTYINFSTEHLTIAKIKKMHELNAAFQWSGMNTNSTKTNTRGLAVLINELRRTSPTITVSNMSDSISKCSQSVAEIDSALKEFSLFQREAYKLKVRTNVMESSSFDQQKAQESMSSEIAEIRKNFSQGMGKIPLYSELISEISEEDHSNNSDAMRLAVLRKLQIAEIKTKKEETRINTKDLLLQSMLSLTPLTNHYSEIAAKLKNNVDVLESSHKSFFSKFIKALRQAFNLKEPPIIYNLIVTDAKKDSKTTRAVDVRFFIASIERKAALYATFLDRASNEFKKLLLSDEESLFQFINKNISENSDILKLLEASDDFFKANAPVQVRAEIKGLKIDLISVKNIIVNANQRRAEYCAYIEESDQMKKIGISNEQ